MTRKPRLGIEKARTALLQAVIDVGGFGIVRHSYVYAESVVAIQLIVNGLDLDNPTITFWALLRYLWAVRRRGFRRAVAFPVSRSGAAAATASLCIP